MTPSESETVDILDAIKTRLADDYSVHPTWMRLDMLALISEIVELRNEVGRLRPYELAYDPDALIEAKHEIKRLWRIIDGPR